MTKPLHVLIVEDCEADALLEIQLLRDSGYDISFSRVDDEKGMREALETEEWDLIISDYSMPHFSGLAALKLLPSTGLDIPIIIVSGTIGESVAVEAMKAGATDYVLKDRLDRLPPIVERALIEAHSRRERAQAEAALQESQLQFQQVFDYAPIGMALIAPDGRWLRVNQALCAMLEYQVEELQSLTSQELTHPEDSERDGDFLGQLRSGERQSYQIEKRYITSNGRIVWALLTASSFHDSGGNPIHFICQVQDISARRQSEMERNRLITAISCAGEAILISDEQGFIQYVNPAFERITGFTSTEATGKNVSILKSEEHEDQFYSEIWNTLLSGKIWNGVVHNKKQDGSHYEVETTISSVVDPWGNISNYVAVSHDVTEKMSMEKQLLQSQRLESVGLLAGGIAHDFNNILQAIFGFIMFAQEGLDPEDPRYGEMDEVRKAAQRAADLIRQLLAFSRQQILQRVDLNLNDLVPNFLKMINRIIGDHIEVDFIAGHKLGVVHVDPGQIDQILMNLCLNARDAMPEGGNILIETENVLLNGNFCLTHPWARPGRYILLTVNDTGSGIDEKTMARIFDPFYTSKEMGRGTGLGLSTVYGIVKQQDGFIHVYSEVGKGTTFKIYFPSVERMAIDIGRKLSPTVHGGTETILVADDDEVVNELVARVLRKAGYRVILASDGYEALLRFNEHASEIDLVFLDVVMPRVGGLELHKEIQKIAPEMLFLFTSGYSPNVTNGHFGIGKGLEVLQKPYLTETLLIKIREILDRR